MRFLKFIFIVSLSSSLFAQTEPAADLIIRNAKVWTVDRSQAEADAVAILGDRVVAVGSSHELDAWRGPHTRVVDAAGKRLLPGFNDAHVHSLNGGSQLHNFHLTNPPS